MRYGPDFYRCWASGFVTSGMHIPPGDICMPLQAPAESNDLVWYDFFFSGAVHNDDNGDTVFFVNTCCSFVFKLYDVFRRTTTCSVPYSSKLAPVSHVLILTWTYQRKVMHKQVEKTYILYTRCSTACTDVLMPPLQCFQMLPAAGIWRGRTGSRCPTCPLLLEGLWCPLSHPDLFHQVPVGSHFVWCWWWEHKVAITKWPNWAHWCWASEYPNGTKLQLFINK